MNVILVVHSAVATYIGRYLEGLVYVCVCVCTYMSIKRYEIYMYLYIYFNGQIYRVFFNGKDKHDSHWALKYGIKYRIHSIF